MKKLILILTPIVLLALGLLLYSSLTGKGTSAVPPEATLPKKLVWWRVFDEEDDVQAILQSFQALHSNITIEYRKLRYEEYEQKLLEAWAKDEGPDIFSIHHTWVGKYESFMTPMPTSTKLAFFQRVKSLGVKEETKIDYRTIPSLKPLEIQDQFVDTVSEDAIRNNVVWGLPLSVDTLALFYNKDLLTQKKIPLPPQTYDEFLDDVKKLTILDREGNIVQAGAALGTAKNIPHSQDILFLFMLQNQTSMTDPSGKRITFTQPAPGDPQKLPGVLALEFYTQFADPKKEVYTWNDQLPNALEFFTQGKLAFFFGYSYDLPIIEQQRKGGLRFGTTTVPKLNLQVNAANYWLETVSKKSPYPNEAWSFIQFAVKRDQVERYLKSSGKPTALKSLITSQSEEFLLKPFVEDVLVAKSWYRGKKPEIMGSSMEEAIENVVSGRQTAKEALFLAERRIQEAF